ncbi:sodium-coupled neutral amino acid transporter 3-like isoform X1 [Phyllopteryx taeniolatus]|uniref:sodium-coupled neutral amino acid transporter 3-like isoform X1 n=1 Tax=Phyllopteryx taeniolatus TaxID=161469 RepID=UPI002AD40D2C|nr:sodium-coupled neutral amino acid transporter 3-like isoform X1 [Phyllopteryx taeniolatus]XP_061641643.1 sodium-coupled neutral amino acid transporter 3-like isoform X1 [Phyllopteryx taeniolatus]
MSEDKPAEGAETPPSEMNAIPNGKGHDVVDEMTASSKTSPVDDGPTETVPNSVQNVSPNPTENAEANQPEGQEFLSGADNSKTTRFTDFEGKTSFGMSVFNLGNAIMGSGILGLAYAMANTGVVLFLVLLTVVAALSSYSIHLLLKSSGIVGIRAYEQLGYRAFGTPGKMAAGIAITLQNIGAMSSYLYIVKYEFPLVIQAFLKVDKPAGEWYMNGNYLVIIVSIAVILPLALMKQLGYLGYTSGFSLSCMVFFLIAVIHKKFNVPCPFVDFTINGTAGGLLNITDPGGADDLSCVPKMANLNSQTAYTIPILAFAFVCHPEVLPIYTELRNPTKKKMQHVANMSIAVMYVMYFLAALFGYLTFYDEVEAELLHTYSRIDPYDTLILCVRVAVLTAVTLTVPIVLFPVRRAIQQMMFPNKTFNWPRHIAIAFTLLAFINLLVIFAPNILGIFGIIGATSAPCLIFIFPAVFYIRIVPKEEEPLRSTPKILAACFAGLGFLFMIMSLSFIIIDWTLGSSKASSGH